MIKEKIYLFDTTLRDGQQTQGVDFSVDDKVAIAKALDDLGLDYIEGGWPGLILLILVFLKLGQNLKIQNLPLWNDKALWSFSRQ